MRKLSNIMEYFWLLVTLVTLGWAMYQLVTMGFDGARQWLWFPLVAGGMFGYRRFMRGKMDQWEKDGRL